MRILIRTMKSKKKNYSTNEIENLNKNSSMMFKRAYLVYVKSLVVHTTDAEQVSYLMVSLQNV